MIYFDNSATTPMAPEVTEVVTDYMKMSFGNPSSRHFLGLEAAKQVALARSTVARAMGVENDEIYFTSGGTEGDNIAVLGSANIKKGKRIVTTAIEHPAVLRCMEHLEAQGFEVVYVNPDKTGAITPQSILEHINGQTSLAAIMHVNNETGAIIPIEKICPAIKRIAPRAHIHIDAVQSFGHIEFKPAKWAVDTASVSSHKIHGPKGTGALYIRKGVALKPTVFGGGQEKNIRSGTENVGAILGFAKACELIDIKEGERVRELKNALAENLLKLDNAVRNGGGEESPYILNISFGKIRSEIMLNALSNAGICVSSGSACSSNHKGSHVLSAMNAPLPDSAIRFSLSRYNTMEEVQAVIKKIIEEEGNLRR